MTEQSKFIQISSTNLHSGADLYALDEEGVVWKYHPYSCGSDGTERFAFWGKITSHRADPKHKS